MQQSPSRKSIQVYFSIDCRIPRAEISSWILVYLSFNDPSLYTASLHLIEDIDGATFGKHVLTADGDTPYHAVQSLKTVQNADVGLIVEIIERRHVFAPTIPLSEIEDAYLPLPEPVILHPDAIAIITSHSLLPAGIANKIASKEAISNAPSIRLSDTEYYRVNDLMTL